MSPTEVQRRQQPSKGLLFARQDSAIGSLLALSEVLYDADTH